MKTTCSSCQREANELEAPRGFLWVCAACRAKADEAPADGDIDVDVDLDAAAEGEPVSLPNPAAGPLPGVVAPPLDSAPQPPIRAKTSAAASARRMARAIPTPEAPIARPAARPQSLAERLASKAFAQDPTPEPPGHDAADPKQAGAHEEERLPDSGLFDIRSMMAMPRGDAKPTARVNDDILNLSGGLFSATSTPLVPLIAPDLRALAAPRPSQRPPAAPASTPRAPLESAEQPPVQVGARAAAAAAPRGRMRLFVLAVVAVGLTAGAFVIAKGGPGSPFAQTNAAADAPITTPDRASSPALQATASPSPEPPSKPAPGPSVNDSADAKGTPKDPDKQAGSEGKPLEAGATATAKATTAANVTSPTIATAPAGAAPPSTAATPATATPPAAPTSKPTATAAAPPEGQPFNVGAASAALGAAAGQAAGCKAAGDPSGTARISVTFAPSGRATSANVNGPPFAGTTTGSCIASIFRRATVPPFTGSATTVNKSVAIR